MLSEGFNAPCVSELAGCDLDIDHNAQQIEQLFQACLVALGLTLPSSFYDALLAYASNICEKTVLGNMDSWDCLKKMLELADDNDTPYILWVWIDLSRDLSSKYTRDMGYISFNGALDLDNDNDSILKTAKQFVSLCSVQKPLKFPLVWWCNQCHIFVDETTFTETMTKTCPTCSSPSAMKNMRFFEHRNEFSFRSTQNSKR